MGQGDSRLTFKQKINQLLEKPIPAADHEFWAQLFTTHLTAEDIFALIPPTDIRQLRKTQPQNLATIIYKSIEQLFLFSQPSNISNEYTSAKNSIRLITRLMPFVLEQNTDNFVTSVFFENTAPSQKYSPPASKLQNNNNNTATTPKSATATPVSATNTSDDEKIKGKGKEVVKSATENSNAVPQLHEEDEEDIEAMKFTELGGEPLTRSLAEVLISTLMEVMFLSGFTVPEAQYKKHREFSSKQKTEEEINKLKEYGNVEVDLLWDNGFLIEKGNTWTWDQVDNRAEVLRCLLTCFTQTLYTPVDDMIKTHDRFITIATSVNIKHTSTLFFSLLNTVFAYNPTGKLPYSSQLVSDPQENLVTVAIHTLAVLLDHKWVPASEQNLNKIHNVYRYYIRCIRKHPDFNYVFTSINKLLYNRIDAVNTYLPNSQKMIKFHEEVLVLLWKFLDENPEFRVYVCKVLDPTQIIIPLLFFIQDPKKDQSKYALIQICSFILLILSGEREFGVALNKPFNQKLPMELPLFTGSHVDLIIIIFHKVIVNDKTLLRPMFDCLLTIICNISPYTKKLTMISSVKLLNLFEAFSAKKFIYSNEKNHHYVFLLLEIFNNLIQYQYEGNIHVVYAILRRHTVFEELAQLPPLDQPLQITTAKIDATVPTSATSTATTQSAPTEAAPAPEATTSTSNSNSTPASTSNENNNNAAQSQQATASSSTDSNATTTPAEEPEQKQEASNEVKEESNEVKEENNNETSATSTATTQSAPTEAAPAPEATTSTSNSNSTPTSTSTSNENNNNAAQSQQATASTATSTPTSTSTATPQQPQPPKFVPTAEWVRSWKSKLPIRTVLTLIEKMLPEVEAFCKDTDAASSEDEILAFLTKTTLVGVLPVPHPILIRKYQTNLQTDLWVTTYIWGLIYLKNLLPPLFDASTIKLFVVHVVD